MRHGIYVAVDGTRTRPKPTTFGCSQPNDYHAGFEDLTFATRPGTVFIVTHPPLPAKWSTFSGFDFALTKLLAVKHCQVVESPCHASWVCWDDFWSFQMIHDRGTCPYARGAVPVN